MTVAVVTAMAMCETYKKWHIILVRNSEWRRLCSDSCGHGNKLQKNVGNFLVSSAIVSLELIILSNLAVLRVPISKLSKLVF